MTVWLHEGGAVPRRALLHDHELWDCFGGGGHAVSEPENPVIVENPVLMELGAGDGALQEPVYPWRVRSRDR
jgi:hypothetical protein